ncbi:MAG: hypothetical protein AAF728_05120 [Cyanobacteria bacterium P01_D01_bin.128]
MVHTLELAIALTRLNHQVCIFALDKDEQGFEQKLPCAVGLIPADAAPREINQLIYQRIQEFVLFLSAQSLGFDI